MIILENKKELLLNDHWSRALLEKEDLDYNKFYKRQIEKFLDISRKDNKILKQIINKAIDKLYCWGEALDPDFQKEMLNILQENK